MQSRMRPGCAAVTFALSVVWSGAPAVAQPREAPVTAAADQARRRQAADELHREGVEVDWRIASWAELRDWAQRAVATRTLRDGCAIKVDWRTMPLPEMRDWIARCTRAAALGKLGVQVDWKAYSVQQLDELRAAMQQIRAPDKGAAPVLPADAPPGVDPDAIIVPSYLGAGARRPQGVPAPSGPARGADGNALPAVGRHAEGLPQPLPAPARKPGKGERAPSALATAAAPPVEPQPSPTSPSPRAEAVAPPAGPRVVVPRLVPAEPQEQPPAQPPAVARPKTGATPPLPAVRTRPASPPSELGSEGTGAAAVIAVPEKRAPAVTPSAHDSRQPSPVVAAPPRNPAPPASAPIVSRAVPAPVAAPAPRLIESTPKPTPPVSPELRPAPPALAEPMIHPAPAPVPTALMAKPAPPASNAIDLRPAKPAPAAPMKFHTPDAAYEPLPSPSALTKTMKGRPTPPSSASKLRPSSPSSPSPRDTAPLMAEPDVRPAPVLPRRASPADETSAPMAPPPAPVTPKARPPAPIAPSPPPSSPAFDNRPARPAPPAKPAPPAEPRIEPAKL